MTLFTEGSNFHLYHMYLTAFWITHLNPAESSSVVLSPTPAATALR